MMQLFCIFYWLFLVYEIVFSDEAKYESANGASFGGTFCIFRASSLFCFVLFFFRLCISNASLLSVCRIA